MAMICGVGRRQGLDPVLLWLWHRLAATALIGPLAWEPPYVTGVALKRQKKKKKKTKEKKRKQISSQILHCLFKNTPLKVTEMICLRKFVIYG